MYLSRKLKPFAMLRYKIAVARMLACAVFALMGNHALAQSQPIVTPPPSHEVKVDIDSGFISNDGDKTRLVWHETVLVKEAKWMRLHFDSLVLTSDEKYTSILKISSLKDGAFQILNPETAQQWRNTSAYFNGDRVLVELFAHPNAKSNRVTIGQVTAGDAPDLSPEESICDSIDDRQLSNDFRAGRTSPGGCTAWLFNNRSNCMITAGHCAGSTDVILFNVPISNSDGSYNFPSPNDQYSVDQTSMQLVNNGVGEDWCYFGCFDNSNTGLSPLAAQGDSYQLVMPSSVNSGDEIRITGYGTTSSPVDPTFNGSQKTHVGPHSEFTGSTLRYRTDTTGGNSGSPVVLEGTGQAIGVHTHAGCSSGGAGANQGTGFNHPDWQNAISNPLGICADDTTPPENDEWNNTINIADPDFSVTGTNVNATTQADEQQLDNTGATVWWYFDADVDGTVMINTCGSDFDTQLHIYTGFELGFPNLIPVANDDDFCGLQSQVTFKATADTCYEIRVGGYQDGGAPAQGNIMLTGTFTPDTGGCPSGFEVGDVNQDGFINLLDVDPFIAAISGAFVCEADINDDGFVNLLDVDPFIALLGGP